MATTDNNAKAQYYFGLNYDQLNLGQKSLLAVEPWPVPKYVPPTTPEPSSPDPGGTGDPNYARPDAPGRNWNGDNGFGTTWKDAQKQQDNLLQHDLGASIPGDILSWTEAIAKFFGALTKPQTWARVGEGLLGVTIIGIGIYAITKGDDSSRKSTVAKVAGQQFQFAATSNIRTQQRANAATRAYETSAARVRGRGDAAVDTAGKKAYATAYNRKMGQRDASLARIIS